MWKMNLWCEGNINNGPGWLYRTLLQKLITVNTWYQNVQKTQTHILYGVGSLLPIKIVHITDLHNSTILKFMIMACGREQIGDVIINAQWGEIMKYTDHNCRNKKKQIRNRGIVSIYILYVWKFWNLIQYMKLAHLTMVISFRRWGFPATYASGIKCQKHQEKNIVRPMVQWQKMLWLSAMGT